MAFPVLLACLRLIVDSYCLIAALEQPQNPPTTPKLNLKTIWEVIAANYSFFLLQRTHVFDGYNMSGCSLTSYSLEPLQRRATDFGSRHTLT